MTIEEKDAAAKARDDAWERANREATLSADEIAARHKEEQETSVSLRLVAEREKADARLYRVKLEPRRFMYGGAAARPAKAKPTATAEKEGGGGGEEGGGGGGGGEEGERDRVRARRRSPRRCCRSRSSPRASPRCTRARATGCGSSARRRASAACRSP